MTDENLIDAHGFVQFDFGFEDEDFVVEEKTSKVPELKQHYKAKQEYNGWFNSTAPVSTLMCNKNGPNELKSSIEYHYLHGRHAEALRLALGYIEYVEQNRATIRVQSTREMLEIAARCALRVGEVVTAVQCVEKIESNDSGTWLLKGEVYEAAGRFADSIRSFIRYNRLRKLDYNAWKHMGFVFLSASTATGSPAPPNLATHLSHLCFLRARTIMVLSRWPNIPFVQRRFQRELDAVEAAVARAKEAGGDVERAVMWSAESGNNEVGKEQLIGERELGKQGLVGRFDAESVLWIIGEWQRIKGEGEEIGLDEEDEGRGPAE